MITARLRSSRLPRKMLADLCGRPVLQRLVERLSLATRPEMTFLATTTEPEDDELAAAGEALGLEVFRGAIEDVLVRWRDAAVAYEVDLLVNCDGDDVFCDPVHIDRIIEGHRETGAEYITCVGLPFGTAPMGVARTGLERICASKLDTNTEGQGRFFAVPGIVSRAEVKAPASVRLDNVRLTLDYPEDLELFEAVLRELQPVSDCPSLEQIVALLRKRPDLRSINAGVQERYWQRFNSLYGPVRMKVG